MILKATPSITSQEYHHWVRFPEPCGCGFIDEHKKELIHKYRKPVLCVIESGTFFYCPGCGLIEFFPHGENK